MTPSVTASQRETPAHDDGPDSPTDNRAPSSAAALLSFRDVVLDPGRRELRKAGELVHVEPKVLDLLGYLLRHRTRVVSRDELLDALWHGEHVSEAALAYCVKSARKAVGDSGDQQHTIATVARRGFRFVADVSSRTEIAGSLNERGTSASPFVGRDAVLAQLRDVLSTSRAGHLRVALIAGEPGIGKTRLTEELSAIARTMGSLVLTGRCHEGIGTPPFWPWTQILRSYLTDDAHLDDLRRDARDELAALVPDLLPSRKDSPAAGASGDERFALFDAIRGVLQRAAARRPLLLVLDDLQWSDAPSLVLLRFVARELPESRLMLVAAYRDTDVGPEHPLRVCSADLARIAGTEHVPLVGLTAADLAQYIERATGSAPASIVARIHAQTGGNPFFATETVRLLHTSEADQIPSTIAGVPPTVREVVARRVAALSTPAPALLRVAAILGREFELADVTRVRDAAIRSRRAVLEGLDEALRARLLERCEAEGSYRFAHDLVRETIYDALPGDVRATLHERVGRVIESAHADDPGPHLAALAHHFDRAATGGDPSRAVSYAVRAAERAASLLAYEDSAEHYRRALELQARRPKVRRRADADGPTTGELLLQLGENEWKSGDRHRARDAFRRVTELARATNDATLLARAALGFGGGFRGFDVHVVDPELVALLEEAFARLPARPTPLRGRVMGRLAIALYDVPETLDRRVALSAAAVEVAEKTRDQAALVAALYTRHWAIWGPDTLDDRVAAASTMQRLAATTGDRECALHAHRFLAVDHLERGERAAMDHHIGICRELAEALRQPYYRWYGVQLLAMRTFLAGQLDESERLLEEAYAIGSRADSRNVEAGLQSLRFWIRREQGRVAELEPMLRAFVERLPDAVSYRCALAVLYVETGRPEAARPHVQRLAAHGFASLARNAFWLSSLIMLSDVCATLGDVARGRELDALLHPFTGRVAELAVGGGCLGSVDRALGRLAHLLGDHDRAERHLADALRIERGLDAPLLVAWTERARSAAARRS